MKKSLSIALAVLLAVGLSITVFPATTLAEAPEPSGAFHIYAEGEGDYEYIYPAGESGTGEFFINVSGQKGWGNKGGRWSRGKMCPLDTVQGHIRGSFGPHEIDVTLTNPRTRFPWSRGEQVHFSEGRLEWVGFQFKGTYDGNKVTSSQCYINVEYDENGEVEWIQARLALADGTPFFRIKMYDASVDFH